MAKRRKCKWVSLGSKIEFCEDVRTGETLCTLGKDDKRKGWNVIDHKKKTAKYYPSNAAAVRACERR
jgi:hypothetical protein